MNKILVSAGLAAVASTAITLSACATTHTPKATTATVEPTASPTVALGAGQVAFVAAVRSALTSADRTSPATDTQIAVIGSDVCNARLAGGSQASVISGAQTGGTEADFSMSAGDVVRTAEADICPAQVPQTPAEPTTVIDMSGTGDQNSSPVTISSGTLTATYSYDCSSFGSSGNFIADLETPNQASMNSDDQSIANALGSGGTATTTIYPQNVGSQYYLSVNSECNWSVKVVSP